jgi:hypothetical protein
MGSARKPISIVSRVQAFYEIFPYATIASGDLLSHRRHPFGPHWPRVVASIGMALTATGLAMLAFLGVSLNIDWVFASVFVLGAGFGFFSSPKTNAVMSSVSRKFYGVASGTLGTMRLTGQAFFLGRHRKGADHARQLRSIRPDDESGIHAFGELVLCGGVRLGRARQNARAVMSCGHPACREMSDFSRPVER